MLIKPAAVPFKVTDFAFLCFIVLNLLNFFCGGTDAAAAFFQGIPERMAYNVPAVYDVLPARIRALRSKDQGGQNVPE